MEDLPIDNATGLPQVDLDKVVARPPNPLANADRITGRIYLHQEHLGARPASFDVSFFEMLDGQEPAYYRLLRKLPTDFVPLYLGPDLTPATAGYVAIHNIRPHRQGRPTVEEAAADALRVLYVRLCPASRPMIVPPGHPLLFTCADVGLVQWCAAGTGDWEAEYTIFGR